MYDWLHLHTFYSAADNIPRAQFSMHCLSVTCRFLVFFVFYLLFLLFVFVFFAVFVELVLAKDSRLCKKQ